MMSALDLVCELVTRNSLVDAIYLFKPIASPPIQDNAALTEDERILIADALDLRASTCLPFWECLLQLISVRDVAAPTLLTLAKRHNRQSDTAELILRERVTVEGLVALVDSLARGTTLALSSRVRCSDGVKRHIPMLDFHCRESAHNDLLVRQIAEALEIKGYLAHSGQSYHFYGAQLISEDELIQFLSKSLLYCPVIDRAWIAHQLIERACGLRISPGKNYTGYPTIFAQV